MKKLFFLSALFINTFVTQAQTPTWAWATPAGGTQSETLNSMAVDASGNVLITGNFASPTITFGSTTLTNSGSSGLDYFVAKYDAAGNVLWAHSAGGGNLAETGFGIASDNANNVIVIG